MSDEKRYVTGRLVPGHGYNAGPATWHTGASIVMVNGRVQKVPMRGIFRSPVQRADAEQVWASAAHGVRESSELSTRWAGAPIEGLRLRVLAYLERDRELLAIQAVNYSAKDFGVRWNALDEAIDALR